MVVAYLRENWILKTVNKDKADILNRQFESVYTREQAGDSHQKDQAPTQIQETYSLTLMGSKSYWTILTLTNLQVLMT